MGAGREVTSSSSPSRPPSSSSRDRAGLASLAGRVRAPTTGDRPGVPRLRCCRHAKPGRGVLVVGVAAAPPGLLGCRTAGVPGSAAE